METIMSGTRGWTLRETLIVTVLGAVFAVLYLGWVQVWLIAQAVFGPVTMDVVMGFWFIASIVAAAIIRKPGVAFAAEVLTAAVQILLGSPAGLLLLVTGAVQGLPVLMAAGIGAAIFSFIYTWIRFDYGALQPGILIAMFILRCLSGALLGGWLGHVIVEALYRTGALAGLAIDHAKRSAIV
jgi:energy-coupling factor transport system substrate-specific component